MKNFKFKNLILICLLVIATISFVACGSLQAMIITNEDGSIDEIVSIKINVDEVMQAGYDVEIFKNDIYLTAKDEAEKLVMQFKTKCDQDMMITTDVDTINTLQEMKEGVNVVMQDWDNNSLAVGVRFQNIDVYKYCYNIDENAHIEYEVEKHFLYNKLYFSSGTMFTKHYDLYNKLSLKFSLIYPNLINDETNELYYTYVTDSSREHSNADFIFKNDFKYYHTWKIDANNVNQTIEIYYNVANAGNWIIVGIGISLLVALILSIIVIIKNKTNKNKNNKLILKLIKKHEN